MMVTLQETQHRMKDEERGDGYGYRPASSCCLTVRGEKLLQKWVILKMAGRRTLPVANSLVAAGLEVWTPREVLLRRRGRHRPVAEIEVAILPTFVFAAADRLHDLARIIASPISQHPQFSIFQWDGRIPLIADRDIQALRLAEERTRRTARKRQRVTFEAGANVCTDEAGFSGLPGVVESSDGKRAWVKFGGLLRVEVATWHLRLNDIHGVTEPTGSAVGVSA